MKKVFGLIISVFSISLFSNQVLWYEWDKCVLDEGINPVEIEKPVIEEPLNVPIQEKVDYSYLRKETRVAAMFTKMWLDWENDRYIVADLAWIANYKWTKNQNVKLRNFLLENLNDVEGLKDVIADKKWIPNVWDCDTTPAPTPLIEKWVSVVFWDEIVTAYKWAVSVWIAAGDEIEEAGLDQPITKSEFVDMLLAFVGKNSWSSTGENEKFTENVHELQELWIITSWFELLPPKSFLTKTESLATFSKLMFWDKIKDWKDMSEYLTVLESLWFINGFNPNQYELKRTVITNLYNIKWISAVSSEEDDNTKKVEEVSNTSVKEDANSAGVELYEKLKSEYKETNAAKEVDETKWTLTVKEMEAKVTPEELEVSLENLAKEGVKIVHLGFRTDDYKQRLVQRAYELWGIDFVHMLECENGNWNIEAVWDWGHAFGLCQMNNRFHRDFPEDYNEDWMVQLEYCYKKWSTGTKFYGPDRRIKGKRCADYVEDRFTLL